MRTLRSFAVQGPLLKTFYDSVVVSGICYGVVWWCSSISAADRKKLVKVSSVLGLLRDSVREVEERRMVAEPSSSMKNNVYPV